MKTTAAGITAIRAILCLLGLGSCGAAALSPLWSLAPVFPMNVVVVFVVGLGVAGAGYYGWQRWSHGRSSEGLHYAAIGSQGDWYVCLALGAIAGAFMGSTLESSSRDGATDYSGLPTEIGFIVGIGFAALTVLLFDMIDRLVADRGPGTYGRGHDRSS